MDNTTIVDLATYRERREKTPFEDPSHTHEDLADAIGLLIERLRETSPLSPK